MAETSLRSTYLKYLPGTLQADAELNRFLLAFERTLTGLPPLPGDPHPQQPGLEAYIDRIYTYFAPGLAEAEPNTAPADFLPWLASWVAVSLRDDWEEDAKRRFISGIVPLYRLRGTKRGLEKLLELYTNEAVTIYEFDQPAHYFQVDMTLSSDVRESLRRKQRIARAILDQEKPAHTYYALQVLTPTMQIRNDLNEAQNIGLIVGQNTILGTTTAAVSAAEP